MLTVVSNGTSQVTIEVSGDSDVALFAASELQHYLQKISGARLPIGAAAGPRISLQVVASASAPGDGHTIEVSRRGVRIRGTTPFGLLHGVYALLEFVGCRWFAPDYGFYGTPGGSDVPRSPTILLPITSIAARAGFSNRKKFVELGLSHSLASLIQLIDWMPKVGLNVLDFPVDCFHRGIAVWDERREQLIPELRKRGIRIEVGGHGYENFVTAEALRTHPEWSGMRAGGAREPDPLKRVFCTSNESAVARLADGVRDYLLQRPEIQVFSFWPPDTRDWCECPTCLSLGPVQYRHALLVNTVARLAQSLRPGLIISMAAYFEPSRPPAGLRLEPNVEVDFCPIVRSHERRIFDPSHSVNRQYHDLLLEWVGNPVLQGDLNIYTYYRKYAWRSLPILLPTLIAEELRHYRSLGVAGIGSYSEAADWWTFELQHYVIAKISFNPEESLDALLQDYFQRRYGPAAQAVADLVRLLESFLPHVARIPGSSISGQSQAFSIFEFSRPSKQLISGYERKVRDCYDLVRKAESAPGLPGEVTDRLLKWRVLIDYVAIEVEARGLALAMSDRATGGYLKSYVAAMTRMAELVRNNSDNGLILQPEWADYAGELPAPGAAGLPPEDRRLLLGSMGVRTIINAGGYQTVYGASQVPDETVTATSAVLPFSVEMTDLQVLASEAIREVTGAEAGCITACAAAGIAIAVAAAMTGTRRDAIVRLPDTSGLKRRVILPAAHDVDFGAHVAQMIRLPGAQLVLAGSRQACTEGHLTELLDDSIAAAVYVISDHVPPGHAVSLGPFIALMHSWSIPVIVDCAAQYDMRAFIAAGADAVIYSAHKVLRGPTAGILAGRQEFIEACRQQAIGIGRPMKVGKEGIVGAMAALKRWMNIDHGRLQQEWRDRTQEAFSSLRGLASVDVSLEDDPDGNPVTRTRIELNEATCGISAAELQRRLLSLDTPIALRHTDDQPDSLLIDPRSLSKEEVETVCQHIIAQLAAAATRRHGRRAP